MSITLEQARKCYELGIKQRKDGKWGYKLHCNNRRCSNLADTCYCQDTVEEAIAEIERGFRGNYHCSNDCWLSDAQWWDRNVEWQDVLDGEEIEKEVRAFYGVPFHYPATEDAEEEEDYESRLDAMWQDLPKSIREVNPGLYSRLQQVARDWISDNADYEPEDGECDCEI